MKSSPLAAAVPAVIPLAFLGLWSILAWRVGNSVILPTVSQVLDLLAAPGADVVGMGSLASNIAVSLVRVVMGYLTAAALAIPLGVVMGYYGTVFRLFSNFLNLFRPIPPLAWVPLVMAWFGISSLATIFNIETGLTFVYLDNLKFSMLFIIFIGAFYPILISTIQGVQGVPNTFIDSARVLGANERQILLRVLIPGALPSIVTGLRIGLGIAWMCLVSAEMLPGSLSGVGYLITHAYTLAATDVVVAGMIGIGVVGALMDVAFRRFEDKKFGWQRLTK